MEDLIHKIYMDSEFIEITKELIENETVQEMKKYRQHFETSCYEHCFIASYYCYVICKKLKLDYVSATRAAMLHDLFLYDWRKRQNGRKGLHAFTHGKTAYENASKLFLNFINFLLSFIFLNFHLHICKFRKNNAGFKKINSFCACIL